MRKCLSIRSQFHACLDQVRALNVIAKTYLYEANYNWLGVKREKLLLRQGLAHVERALVVLATHRAPREEARALWLRGELRARLGFNPQQVKVDLNAVLRYRGDQILLVKAHKTLKAIYSAETNWRLLEFHAKEALKLLRGTGKLQSWEQEELESDIEFARSSVGRM